jgi:hypothetical protein
LVGGYSKADVADVEGLFAVEGGAGVWFFISCVLLLVLLIATKARQVKGGGANGGVSYLPP